MIDSQTVYLIFYIIVGLYLISLGVWMLLLKGDPLCTRGEQKAKRRLTLSVGSLMIVGSFGWLVYLPPMLYTTDYSLPVFKICFLSATMVVIPMVFVVMRAILQKWNNTILGAIVLFVQFLVIDVWFIMAGTNDMLQAQVAGFLSLLYLVCFLIRFTGDYRNYASRLRSEYSETTNREIFWTWWSFAGFAVQMLVFLVEQFFWNFTFEIIYMVLTIVNTGYICFCTYHHKPMDIDIVPEVMDDVLGEKPSDEIHDEKSADNVHEDKLEEKAFYAIIEQKLESLCERKQLYLEPDLTRETLCARLSVGRTYLSMYLHSHGLSFYKYINTLRVKHAISLMQENPDIPLREICRLSGFRSQTTFRKVFQEVMGCKPSEMRMHDVTQNQSSDVHPWR